MAGKIAVVTGANKGIGYEIAKNLGERGYRVIVAARDETRGTAAAAEIHAFGYDTAFLQLDIRYCWYALYYCLCALAGRRVCNHLCK